MSRIAWMVIGFLVSCSGSSSTQDPIIVTNKPAGEACATGAECAGGTCLGAKGQPQEGNPRFAGGYCSALSCTIDTQDGCGADEFCVDGGTALGGFCVKVCSRANGEDCKRADSVCLGIGNFGGCFSSQAVECDRVARTGCKPEEICVKIGFDAGSRLGRCETACDPMNDECPGVTACYYIKTYSAAFCGTPGKTALDESCSCDKCCVPGLGCTPDDDGSGRHCKPICDVATGTGCAADEHCKALKTPGSPWGGCIKD